MESLKDFGQELFTNLNNKPTIKNVYHSMSLILKSGSCCMYSSATDVNIYEKIERTLSRTNKMSTIEPKLINEALINKAVEKFNSSIKFLTNYYKLCILNKYIFYNISYDNKRRFRFYKRLCW